MNVKYLVKSKTPTMKNNDKKDDIITKLKGIFGDVKGQLVIENITSPKPKTFRLNLLKTPSEKDFDEIKNSIIPTIIPNSFVVIDQIQISKTKLNEGKYIYIQELSSMLPVIALDPQPGERILDMCASPGSKTSMIQSVTMNKGLVTAVEKSLGRFYKLKEIVTDQGCENVDFIHSDANYLIKRSPELEGAFDKVLLDAPCSNEGGIVLSEPSTYKYWSGREAKQISKLQKGLLNTASKLVKVGGEIIYSTCTFSVEENEEVLDWFLKRSENFEILEANLGLENSIPGITTYKDKPYSKQISNSVRVLPDKYFKGFFLAKLKRLS